MKPPLEELSDKSRRNFWKLGNFCGRIHKRTFGRIPDRSSGVNHGGTSSRFLTNFRRFPERTMKKKIRWKFQKNFESNCQKKNTEKYPEGFSEKLLVEFSNKLMEGITDVRKLLDDIVKHLQRKIKKKMLEISKKLLKKS